MLLSDIADAWPSSLVYTAESISLRASVGKDPAENGEKIHLSPYSEDASICWPDESVCLLDVERYAVIFVGERNSALSCCSKSGGNIAKTQQMLPCCRGRILSRLHSSRIRRSARTCGVSSECCRGPAAKGTLSIKCDSEFHHRELAHSLAGQFGGSIRFDHRV